MEQFAIKPRLSPSHQTIIRKREINLYSNYFEIKISKNESKTLNKYSIRIEPEIAENSYQLLSQVMKHHKKDLQLIFCPYIQYQWTLYSGTFYEEETSINIQYDGQSYKIIFTWLYEVENNSQEYYTCIKQCFYQLMKNVRFEQIGRNCFNPERATKIPQHKLELWPGFDCRLNFKEGGIFLNIDPCYKIIRFETALDFIVSIRDNCDNKGLDFDKEIVKEFENCSVVTIYNQKCHQVSCVVFDKTPQSIFVYNGKEISFMDYYERRYKIIIKDSQQPLLGALNKRTGEISYLVPELCRMTGFTQAILDDFKAMRDIKFVTQRDAHFKVEECQRLFQSILENKRGKETVDELGIQFYKNPLKVKAKLFEPGKLLMGVNDKGERIEFDIRTCGHDLERKAQCKMFDQPQITKWGIFYQERDSNIAKEFLINMEKCIAACGYPAKQMASFIIKGTNLETWRSVLLNKLDNSVQAIVLILPGSKGRCQLYDDIKTMLLTEIPIVSQVILTQTILRGRNVRSLVSKILIQICAKIGGVPWTIDQIPLLDRPTMVCGLDVFHSTSLGKKSVLGFCASFNNTATKYWSKTVIQDVGQEASHNLQQLVEKGLKKFQKLSGKLPERIIFYRDGVGDKQLAAVSDAEIYQIKQGMGTFGLHDSGLIYINVCKRINTRLFAQGEKENSYKNPIEGMVVDQTITEKGMTEFYLISTNCRQGMVKPTRYTVCYNSCDSPLESIEMLTYKLCHTYFNVAGSISVPAPVQYAHKIAALVGERGSKDCDPPVISDRFEENSGLFFI